LMLLLTCSKLPKLLDNQIFMQHTTVLIT